MEIGAPYNTFNLKKHFNCLAFKTAIKFLLIIAESVKSFLY